MPRSQLSPRPSAGSWPALRRLLPAAALLGVAVNPLGAGGVAAAGGAIPPQGFQSNASYAASYAGDGVTSTAPTEQAVSCYRPEVPFFTSAGPNDGYTGMSPCPGGGATTGEDTGAAGPFPTQAGSNPGYPAGQPMLVKDHSESDIRVDPTNPQHLIASSKWFVSAEGYNHLLGFYESFDGGRTWPVQGHIPGYEGWTDNTDPVGAFDGYGNYYEFILPYQFFYNANGTHDSKVNPNLEPNRALAAEAVAVAVRPEDASSPAPATDWITTNSSGQPDYVATYDSIGNEPDKQWITIDDNPSSPFYNHIYLMWVDFHDRTPVPYVSTAVALANGTHTPWSPPEKLPLGSKHPQGLTFLLPHVAPNGDLYTTLTSFEPEKGFCCANIVVDVSRDGAASFSGPAAVATDIAAPPAHYANTTFRDGIEDTFGVGTTVVDGSYPLYVAWEDYSTGVVNVMLSASFDGGSSWSRPIRVNDNPRPVDEFQPNLAVAPDGTVSVDFYDRRLACPAAGTAAARAAGLRLDTVNPADSGSLPPYGASNYCVNSSMQFYSPTLSPIGHNIRISADTWDPQLNSPYVDGPSVPLTFIGDYFGNTFDAAPSGLQGVTTSATTYDDGGNPHHDQQQVVSFVPIP